MYRRLYLVLAPALALCGHPGAAGAEDAGPVIDRLKEAAAAHEYVQLVMVQETTMMEQTMQNHAVIRSAGRYMTMDTQTSMPGGVALESKIVMDGDTVWTHLPIMNMVQKLDLVRLRAEAPDMAASAEQKPYDILGQVDTEQMTYLGSVLLDGTATEHFRASAASMPAMPGLPQGTIELWVAADDGITRKMVLADSNGNPVSTQRISDVDCVTPIPPETFEFVLPEGAQVKDMTDLMVKMWRMQESPTAPASAPASAPTSAPTDGPASAPTSGPTSAPASAPTSAPVQ